MFPKIFTANAPASPHAQATEPSVSLTTSPPEGDEASPHSEQTERSDTTTTKMSAATEIYRRMSRKKGSTRKEIVAAFIEEVGLTKAGAATYYQIIKKGRR